MTNSANGLTSFDISFGNVLVNFFNRNTSQYPTEVGSLQFDATTIFQERDLHLNQAYLSANQELYKLKEHAEIIEKQYQSLQKRVMLTELVHKATYMFTPQVGQTYHLYHELTQFNNRIVLMRTAPDHWSNGIPAGLEYKGSIRKLGDNTWENIDEKSI